MNVAVKLLCSNFILYWQAIPLARVCIKGIIHFVAVLLFTEPRGEWHQYNININIQISFEIHNSVCNLHYVHIFIQGERHCAAERRGLELLGVVHSLIHYVALEKALSHSAV